MIRALFLAATMTVVAPIASPVPFLTSEAEAAPLTLQKLASRVASLRKTVRRLMRENADLQRRIEAQEEQNNLFKVHRFEKHAPDNFIPTMYSVDVYPDAKFSLIPPDPNKSYVVHFTVGYKLNYQMSNTPLDLWVWARTVGPTGLENDVCLGGAPLESPGVVSVSSFCTFNIYPGRQIEIGAQVRIPPEQAAELFDINAVFLEFAP